MKTQNLLKTTLMLVLLFSSSVFAKEVAITCPLADQVSISNSSATGDAFITAQPHLIQMGGDTNSSAVDHYIGSLFYDGMLACAYKGDKGDFGIMNYNINGNLTHCHFYNDQAKCKDDNIKACTLFCKDSASD